MSLLDLLKAKRETILELAARHGAHNVRVFGSVARGEAGPDSDVDLLIDLDRNRSLFDQLELKQEIEDLLGRKVDLVTEQSIYWLLRRRILKEAIPL